MFVVSEARVHGAPNSTPHGSGAKCDIFEEKLKKKTSVFGAHFIFDFLRGGMVEV